MAGYDQTRPLKGYGRDGMLTPVYDSNILDGRVNFMQKKFIEKHDPTNPKDRIGSKKVSLTKFPATALLHGSMAMMNGAEKYGAYNWRGKPIKASIYIDALLRHSLAWFEGEEHAQDSDVHHLGHALACAAILLDAQATGNLVDDRPDLGNFSKVLDNLNHQIKKSAEKNDQEK